MAAPQPQGPYRIETFRVFVPRRMRFVALLIFAVVFQFSGGIYLASVSQMVGGKSLLQEDIMMAGYVGFIGMTMIFPLLFRIKFRFKSREIVMVAAAGIALCNIVTMYTSNMPVLLAACFVAGTLRMVGTFECLSTLQLKITPTRNMTVFFCAVYTLVLASMQLSGITAVYLDYFFSWQYMHLLIIALAAMVGLLAFVLMKDLRIMKRLPLYGIDWKGYLLWTVFLLSAVFVLQYGKYFDWFDSAQMRLGAVICGVSFMMAVRRMFTARRPYISPQLFRYKGYKSGLAMVFAMILLLSTGNTVQSIFTGGLMHYDSLNAISLNWLVLAGVIVGIVASWYTLAVIKMAYKPIIFIGFACLVAYQAVMYFAVDPHMNIETLYLPSLLRGAGYAILYVSLTLYPTRNVPFPHFFQALSVMGFIRTGFVSVLGASMLSNWMTYLVKKNTMLLGWQLDALNAQAVAIPAGSLSGELSRQAMLVSIKEIFGWFTIGGIVVLLLIISFRYVRPVARVLPDMKYLRRYILTKYSLRKVQPARWFRSLATTRAPLQSPIE